jgi:hypothetical protein
MEFNKQLVLFHYILEQFGYKDFDTLRDDFSNLQTGYDATGKSYFVNSLLGSRKSIDDTTLLQYDAAIKSYEQKLKRNRSELFLSFKYFQYLALLFTEYYLDCLYNESEGFLKALNEYKNTHKDFNKITDYISNDLKKLAYWMATGSGKTLIMHCNYWQIRKYQKEWENIILITPNEGLSKQHYENFKESGIDAKLYSGSEESLKTQHGEILIIEITKLVQEKEGEGVSVDVDYFSENRNLVFIDEGHKGQRSQEQAWKKLRDFITRGNESFTFEYSATFGQIITNTTSDLFQEYSKTIIFDYSYRHFYADGYGKDFTVYNIDAPENYNEEQEHLLLTASLIGYYEQLELFEQYKHELRPYNIEKPLWVFIGSKVIGNNKRQLNQTDKLNISDVTRVIKFFEYVLANPDKLKKDIDTILDEQSGLLNDKGDDIFKDRFAYLKKYRPDTETILSKVFNGAGQMEAYQIKQEEGEIGLKTTTAKEHQYFGVINIGDVAKYSKKLEEDTNGSLIIQEDNFTKSLFENISAPRSNINILIGSKKFIEGWNSWRVSSMGLMNMGRNEGAQIIQLFGRGVRLKGKNYSLKREPANAPYHIKALQNISIVGLNASYMNNFLQNIEKETPEYEEHTIDIQFNYREKWENKILTFKTEEGHNFKNYTVVLDYNKDILHRVNIDLRSKVRVAASSFDSSLAESEVDYRKNFLHYFVDFIDFNQLMLDTQEYCLLKGYTNLIIQKPVLEDIIKSDEYKIHSHKDQFTIKEAIEGKIYNVATMVIKDYINKFYSDKEKDFLTRNLTFDMLSTEKYPEIFPEKNQMVVKAPKEYTEAIEQLTQEVENFYNQDLDEIPTIHFDKHLYSPLAVWKKGSKYQQIKTSPVKLNQGETDFLSHLRDYLRIKSTELEDTEVYILRNLSQKGVGFFIESSSFFPDFILWVVKNKEQHIFFLDPKGLQYEGNFQADKIVFCTQLIKKINKSIQQKIQKSKKDFKVNLNAFILSVTPYEDLRKNWGNRDATKQDFINHNVLFINEDKHYLNQIFGDII